MKLYEAVSQMKTGEHFLTGNTRYIMEADGNLYDMSGDLLPAKELVLFQGEIIRADPEVLTAEEIVIAMFPNTEGKRLSDVYQVRISKLYEVCSKFRKNGQIKEWKRLKPFIDAVKRQNKVCVISTEVIKFVEKLTPPWEPEK